MIPNDLFKRPGPHHAYEVDPAKHRELRAAIAPLEELGDATRLATLLGRTPAEVSSSWVVSSAYSHCLIGEDFGLSDYGPMFERVGLTVSFGTALIPTRDPKVAPISHVWCELRPHFPQCLAPASQVLTKIHSLVAPPATLWSQIVLEIPDDEELFQDDDEDDIAFDKRLAARAVVHQDQARAIVAKWRVDSRAEVSAFVAKLEELAARDCEVYTWSNDQGWL